MVAYVVATGYVHMQGTQHAVHCPDFWFADRRLTHAEQNAAAQAAGARLRRAIVPSHFTL